LEDIREEEGNRERNTADRTIWSLNDSTPSVFSMGNRTFTIHRIRYEQDIQRIRRSLLGLT
jgi:hypothetical protein